MPIHVLIRSWKTTQPDEWMGFGKICLEYEKNNNNNNKNKKNHKF